MVVFVCVCQLKRSTLYADLQSQKAVTAYLKSKQLVPFGFARQYKCNAHNLMSCQLHGVYPCLCSCFMCLEKNRIHIDSSLRIYFAIELFSINRRFTRPPERLINRRQQNHHNRFTKILVVCIKPTFKYYATRRILIISTATSEHSRLWRWDRHADKRNGVVHILDNSRNRTKMFFVTSDKTYCCSF